MTIQQKAISSTTKDLQNSGFNYVEEGDFYKALDCFNEALSKSPKSWILMQSIGNCHMELGQYDKAIKQYQKSIEVGGLHASQCKNIAAVYQRLGEPKRALSWLRLACSVDPAMAADGNVLAAIAKMQDPANNPTGSQTATDYLSSLVFSGGWSKESMPIKIYMRKNYQIPEFYDLFNGIVKDSFDQWCAATNGDISYKFVSHQSEADVICDYTDRRELVSSQHELGIDGNTEMLVKRDSTPGSANIVVLVKDFPGAPKFRKHTILAFSCLHEVGHALRMHGHSPNRYDVMFPVATNRGAVELTDRGRNTIRKIYKKP